MAKTVFITGSSSGIGRATAYYFYRKGWNVVATMRNPENEKEFNEKDNFIIARLDLLDLSSIKIAIDLAIEKFGTIDVLVNNAGYGAYGALESFHRENIVRQFNTNVIGLLDVTRAVIPHFRSKRNGILVNISSVGGKITFPLGSLYHGTKFAIEGISESLSFELSEIGCKVKLIEPGAVCTDFSGRSLDFSNNETMLEYQSLVKKVQSNFPKVLYRMSQPDDVAKIIFESVTDGTDKLRYKVGEDAYDFLSERARSDSDELFLSRIKNRFDIQ